MNTQPSADSPMFAVNTVLDRLKPLRHGWPRFILALMILAIALFSTNVAEALWGSTRFLIMAAAISLSTVFLGFLAGLTTACVATLAVDFLYLPPVFKLSLDSNTLRVAFEFASLVLLTHLLAQRVSTRVRKKAKLGTVGSLDAVVDGEAYGWAFDADYPSTPVNLVVYVNHQPVAETAAVYYRSDVAARLNCSGQHGFYVDVSEFCPPGTESVIEIRLANPTVLGSSLARTQNALPRPTRSSPVILFMHIPRTAGTAFREAIAANYKQSEIAYLYPDPPGFLVEDLRLLPLQQRSRFHIVFGHFRYGVHEWFPQPSQYIAIVRHPFSRIVSHYFYLSQTNPSAITAYGRKLNLVETLEHQLTVNLDNAVVRCFSGVDESDVPPGAVDRDVYNLAMHRLRNSFAFVGHQEYAEQAFASLRRQFGWSQHAHLDKVNSNPKLPDSLQQEKVRAAVEHYNRWDYLFYKDLLERFPPK